MPFTSNLIHIAKGVERSSFIRTKVQQDARTSVFNSIKQSLEKIKLERLQAQDGFEQLSHNAQQAAENLAALHPPVAADTFQCADQANTALQAELQNFEAAAARTDTGLIALNRLKIKNKLGLKVTGNEFARIKSLAVFGEKHPVVKVNLPVRGEQPVATYVENAHHAAQDYIEALETRSPFVSPRLAAYGKDIKQSVTKYTDALHTFDEATLDGTEQKVAEYLSEASIPVKILQNGKFRIQIRNRSDVGNLSAKIKLDKQSMEEHIQEGLFKAARLGEALEKDAASPMISNRMLRNNFVQKQVDFKALEHFETAKAVLNEESDRIQALQQQGLFVKVLRNGAFRITRYNTEGVVAKTRTIPITKHMSMTSHIENGLAQAEQLSTVDLPAKISTKQQLKNKFSPFKKAVLNFLG